MPDLLSQLPAPRTIEPERAAVIRQFLVEHARTESPRTGSAPRTEEPRTSSAPRPGIHRRRTTRIAALVASVAAVTVAVTILTDVARPGAAYATWTATPSDLPGGETAALGSECAVSVRDAFPNAPQDLRPVLGERRGTMRTALIASGSTVALCAEWLGARDGQVQSGNTVEGLVTDADLPAGEDLSILAVPGQVSGDGAARVVFGRVAAEVATVWVLAKDGTRITASVAGGYYLAWWPSGADVDQVTALDADGGTIARRAP